MSGPATSSSTGGMRPDVPHASCVVDEVAREALAIPVTRGLTSSDGLEVLAELMLARGRPSHIRSDNGPEVAAAAVTAWLGTLGVTRTFIEPGSPWENGHVESVNSTLRDGLLDGEIFSSPEEAQILIEGWRRRCNTVRPHAALGSLRAAPDMRITPPAVRPPPGPSIEMATNATLHSHSDWIRDR